MVLRVLLWAFRETKAKLSTTGNCQQCSTMLQRGYTIIWGDVKRFISCNTPCFQESYMAHINWVRVSWMLPRGCSINCTLGRRCRLVACCSKVKGFVLQNFGRVINMVYKIVPRTLREVFLSSCTNIRHIATQQGKGRIKILCIIFYFRIWIFGSLFISI